MKKGFSIVFIALMCFQLAASVMEYDIGGGQTLLLKEDGTYEIVEKTIDINKIIGKQYKFDLRRSLDLLISIVMLEDPTSVMLGKDYYYSLFEDTGIIDMISSEIPDISFIFLSEEKVFVTMEGEEPLETSYRITPSNNLYIVAKDGTEQEIGTFSKDYGEIMLSFSEDFPVYLVQQK